MKQELPIAIALLAIGCMLWFWQTKTPNTASAASQAGSLRHVEDASKTQSKPGNNHSKQLPNAAANELLLKVANDFENGSSRLGDLEIECRLNGTALKLQGRFWENGLGSGKSRIELVTDGAAGKVTHVCDGRLVYKLVQRHDQRTLSFVRLGQLNTQDARVILSTLPGSWVGTGSVGTMLRNLGEAFELEQIQPSDSSGTPLELQGTWNLNHLSKLMLNHVDHREIISTPNWSKIPQQFPHGVRIQIAQVGNSLQPAAIQFFRIQESGNLNPENMLTIKFGQVQQRSFSQSLFQMDSNESGAIDETQLYRERIEMLIGRNRIAEDAGPQIR